jgi:membrane-associated phospholipid phosphatase
MAQFVNRTPMGQDGSVGSPKVTRATGSNPAGDALYSVQGAIGRRQPVEKASVTPTLIKAAGGFSERVEGPRRNAGRALIMLVAAGLSCAALVWVSIALIDRPVATWVHGHVGNGPGWFTTTYYGPALKFGPFALLASPAVALGPLTVFGFVLLATAACAGWRPRSHGRIVLALCVAAFAANEINSFVKGIFGRTWPESWMGDNPSWIRDQVFGFFPFHGGLAWASFPSGHTTIITATMTVAWVLWPGLRPIWGTLVAVVIVGLIGGNYHFVSDIIGGLYLGVGIGLGVVGLLLSPTDLPHSGRAGSNWTLMPRRGDG